MKMRFTLLLASSLLLFRATIADDSSDRNDAFIGYFEKPSPECTDQLPDCKERSHNDGCLKDPYNMRTFCPFSCSVERCLLPGTLKVKHKGHATKEGTEEYARRWAALATESRAAADVIREDSPHFRTVQVAGASYKLSSLGVGTYLGNPDARTDEAVTAAVIYSVVNGWNVIDTASNYRLGHAEQCVGQALGALLAGRRASDFKADTEYRADITRDMVFISSKVGFVDSHLLHRLVKSKAMSKADVASDCHTLAPAYLQASLDATLDRLNVETVDLLYLHNAAEVQLPAVGRSTFMARLKKAFVTLEAARSAGKLTHYGLATWDCFRRPPSDALHLSLEQVVALARQAANGTQGGFAFVQLPVSAAMMEAFQQPWQPLGNRSVTLMEAAHALGVGVFASGPLMEAELVRRLTGQLDSVVGLRRQPTTAQKLLQLSRSTPGVVSALVGHKTREYVMQNAQLSRMEPLQEAEFLEAAASVGAIMQATST